MKAHLYILYSEQLGKFYIGATENIEERIRRHLSNHTGFTSRVKDWVLVHQEEFEHINLAKQRERQIKAWKSSLKIRDLITKNDLGS